jgi:pSer/pThr/pTyr-binding forkhead associated (FHA) protein
MSDLPTPEFGEPPAPALVPAGARKAVPIPLTRPFILIGARTRSHLHLVSKTISRSHACLIRDPDGYLLRDLASRTGVIVNGKRVKEAELRDGDNIEIGSFRFRYTSPPISFSAPASAPHAALLSIDAGVFTPLDARTFLIGRRGKADISLNSQAVSKSHALLFRLDGKHQIRDLGSRTGTLVNGNPVRQHTLQFGDEITIGDSVFRYRPAVPQQPAAPVAQVPASSETRELAPADVEQPAPPTADQPRTTLPRHPQISAPRQRRPAPMTVEAPIKSTTATVLAPETQQPLSPLTSGTFSAHSSRSVHSADSPPAIPPEAQPHPSPSDSETEDDSDPEEFDDSGPVPWRGASGQPLYVRMCVPQSLFWFPALARIADPGSARPANPADRTDPS